MKNRSAWAVAAIVAAVLGSIALAADPDPNSDADSDSGGALYTPTRAEWLCVLLNMDEAVSAEMQWAMGAGVRFRYDHTRPDTVEIEVLYNANVGANERRNRAEHAERQARELAKIKGWDGWLKTKLTETKITRRPGVKPLEE
jgi:hypothetical protein